MRLPLRAFALEKQYSAGGTAGTWKPPVPCTHLPLRQPPPPPPLPSTPRMVKLARLPELASAMLQKVVTDRLIRADWEEGLSGIGGD